ncbi:unnamed protein product [Polarella glacialis]|uniref:Tubulin--tyrosine ligase-like protein 9 n=1 Tax=Polarella glacialis TaxID=89957 RepID=A0A813KTW9_POLGL|nr:unnamed protein product [Polarella glacialis]
MPFSTDLAHACSHVTNLSLEAATPSGIKKQPSAVPAQRLWATADLDCYLRQETGREVWTEQVLPAIKSAVARIINAARPLCTGGEAGCSDLHGGAEAPRCQPWRRLGFDFAVDQGFRVWLIEVNHKPGMRAPKGQGGEAKRRLMDQFYEDERRLCTGQQPPPPQQQQQQTTKTTTTTTTTNNPPEVPQDSKDVLGGFCRLDLAAYSQQRVASSRA